MTRNTFITLVALSTSLLVATAALAQGTATGPSTVHLADNTGVAYAGGPNDTINGPAPYPIDLDPTGPPWRKAIVSDPLTGFAGFGSFNMVETVQNVGTEPWFDWHEDLFGGALGVGWNGVLSVTVNGSPITFNETILGNSLWIDTFSQPVLPGDVMTIDKTMITTSNVVAPNVTLFEILEYPTPEPGSAALMGAGVLLLIRRVRRGAA